MRIVLVSDTHLAPRAPGFSTNLRAVAEWAATLAPDLVVHLGDAVAHGVDVPASFEAAAEALSGIACPVRWLPGNHDIGEDRVTAAASGEPPVSPYALAAWRAVFGQDYWSVEKPGWQIIGLNAQLFGAGDAEDRRQWAWLEGALAASDARLGVMLHKPIFRDAPEEATQHQRYIAVGARGPLWRALRTRDLRFVACGHTHQLRQTQAEGIDLVWAPSAAYRIPDALQEPVGKKIVGAMTLELTPEGHRFAFVRPPGVLEHDLTNYLDLYPKLKAKATGRAEPP